MHEQACTQQIIKIEHIFFVYRNMSDTSQMYCTRSCRSTKSKINRQKLVGENYSRGRAKWAA